MYIYGAGGHAKVVIDILENNSVKINGLFDDNFDIKSLFNYPVLSIFEIIETKKEEVIISIGVNSTRKEIVEKYKFNYGKAIHQNTVISARSTIGEGSVVVGNVTINSDAKIGKHVIINTSSTIGHDCIIEDFAHISPNATLCGEVTIGEGAHVGAGAIIIPSVKIGKWAIVGAGSVIIKDVPDFATVVGNPGRVIKFAKYIKPLTMKNLIIIGAGGMGREIFNLATLCKGYNTEFKIKGFLDDDKDALRNFDGYPLIIDTIRHYIPKTDDVFVCSMGDVVKKKRSINIILDKGGEFIHLIHPEASICKNVKMGKGCIILGNAFVGVECTINDYVMIQANAVIGHDVKIGKYSRVDCNVVCVGGIELKDEVTIHSGAVINDRVIVEKGAIVGALSFVIRKVKENTTVFGNPAKKL